MTQRVRKQENGYVKICPSCGSINRASFTIVGAGILYDYCEDCGYGRGMGGFFPEVKRSDITNFREKLKKSRKDV